MKRISPNSMFSVFAYLVVLGLSPFPAHAEEAALPAPRDLAAPSLPLSAMTSPLANEGVALSAALALPAAPAIEGGGLSAAVPALPQVALPTAANAYIQAASKGVAPKQGDGAALPREALGQAESLGASLKASHGQAPAEGAPGAFDAAFDGSAVGGSGGAGDGGSAAASQDDAPLDKAYPKVVIILDAFKGAASETTVRYVEKLADLGVHVVFVTPRAEKGDNSAEAVLTSQLRTRAGNPVMIVSYNGARIAMHKAARSENPKGAVPDAEGFAPAALELFSAVNGEIAARYRVKPLGETRSGGEQIYFYGTEFQLPKSLSNAKRDSLVRDMVKGYNARLQAAGLDERATAAPQADGKVALYIQSASLHLNTGRIFAAIRNQYPDLRDRLRQEDVLLLADSTRAARFLATLPGKDQIPGHGYLIHGVTDEAELQQGLFAVLHGKGLDEVKVTRNELRSYVSWLEARQRYGDPRGGGGFRLEPSLGRYQAESKFYLAIVHYHLMAELYHRIRNHDFDHSSLAAALELLDSMARNPKAYGINLPDEMEGMRGSKKWRSFERERLGVMRQWLTNYYERNFPNFPKGVSERVVGTLINLSRDSGTNIKLFYESPATKRRYQVGVLPARGQVEKDDQGYLLVVHAYRTGKEMRQDDFEESLEINLAMRAMLQGYAKKEADGRWTVNGEPARVMAIYHTMTRDMPSDILTPEQVEARSGEVTALIEKMLADKEFLAYWQAEQEKNQKAAVGRATKKAKQAARPARKRQGKAS